MEVDIKELVSIKEALAVLTTRMDIVVQLLADMKEQVGFNKDKSNGRLSDIEKFQAIRKAELLLQAAHKDQASRSRPHYVLAVAAWLTLLVSQLYLVFHLR
jgi:hypothetical protein